MELFHFALMYTRKALELKIIAQNYFDSGIATKFRKFLY